MLGPREAGRLLQPANVFGPGWQFGPCVQPLQLHVVRCLHLCPFFFYYLLLYLVVSIAC